MKQEASIVEILASLSDKKYYYLWNLQFREYGGGLLIGDVSEVDDIIKSAGGQELINEKNLNRNDKYFVITEDGNLYSFNDLKDEHSPFNLDILTWDILNEICYAHDCYLEDMIQRMANE